MRELLLAFIFALVVGSIINGMQQKPNSANPAVSGQGSPGNTENPPANQSQDTQANPSPESTPNSSGTATSENSNHRDFPDVSSFANVDKTNFDTVVLNSAKPVFINCYVPNNLACDQMIPLVAAVAKSHENSILMAKLNVMDNIVLAHRYEVGSVPTFLLFDRGTLMGKLSGVLSQDRLESMIANLPHGDH